MTQQPSATDQQADADVPEPARLRAGGSNDYGSLPSVVRLEDSIGEHPVPEPSGSVSEENADGGEDGDGD